MSELFLNGHPLSVGKVISFTLHMEDAGVDLVKAFEDGPTVQLKPVDRERLIREEFMEDAP